MGTPWKPEPRLSGIGAKLLAGGDANELNRRFDDIWNRIGHLDGVRKMAQQFGVARQLESCIQSLARAKLTDKQRQHILVDELLAHIAGKGETGFTNTIKAYVGALRVALRNAAKAMGLDKFAAKLNAYTDTELLYDLQRHRKAVRQSRVAYVYCGVTSLVVLAIATCRGAEIAGFKLTGIDGYALVDFLHDGFTSGSSRQTQSDLSEKVFVMTHSYVFHPNFLTLDIGGGFTREDLSLDTNAGTTRSGENLFSFPTHANFLSGKPIQGSLFYDHLNPSVSVAPGEIMVQETDQYGFHFSMSNVDLGLPLSVGYTHNQIQGKSTGRIIDEELEQINFNISHAFGSLGSSNFHFQSADQSSRSGSLSLPIQASTSSFQGANLNTRLQFGEENKYGLTNNIFYNKRKYALALVDQPEQSDFGFLLDFRGYPSKKLNYFGTYNLNRSDQGLTNLTIQSLIGGFSYLPATNLETSFSLKTERNEATQYRLQSNSADGSIRYKFPLWPGNMQISYAARYEQRDQQASNPLVDILDEQHTLSGTTQIPLNNLHVVAGSVVVTNQAQTQTYIENVDYILILIGAETRIQRLIGGNIIDGDTVLVDYTYDIGGSYASNQLDQTLNLNWRLARDIEAYFRLYDSSPNITSGFSSYQLNKVRDILLGFRAEAPLIKGFSLGGSIETEDRDETISPYRRLAGDVFLQTTEPVFSFLNLRATARQSFVNYTLSSQDQELRAYEIRAWARRFGVDFNGSAGMEEDVGAPIPRKREDYSLNAVWRKRKLTLTSGLTYTRESQGSYSRDHTIFRISGKRDF